MDTKFYVYWSTSSDYFYTSDEEPNTTIDDCVFEGTEEECRKEEDRRNGMLWSNLRRVI